MIAGDKGVGASAKPGPTTIGQDGVIRQGTPSGPAHEGSRETYDGRIISVPRDYCWTPCGSGKVLIGYKIWAFQREATNLADTVTQTSLRSHVKGSIIKHCYGDDAGKLGGIISGTHNSWCTPKTWSETVTFGGRNAVRDSDEWWMNRFNTWGVLDYKKDMNTYNSPESKQIQARMFLAQYAAPIEGPGGLPLPGPSQYQQAQGVTQGLVQGAGHIPDALNWYKNQIIDNTIRMVALTASLKQQLANIVRTTNNNPCPVLVARILSHMADMQTRRQDLLQDQHGLFGANHDIGIPPFGSWNGHVERYNSSVTGLQNAILMAKAAGCKVPPAAYLYLTLKTPGAPL